MVWMSVPRWSRCVPIDATLHSVVEDVLVEEHQGIHGLVLGGGRDVSMHHQVGQEGLDRGFGRDEVFARAHAVETDESYDPLPSGSLSVHGVVVQTEPLSHVSEECGWWISRRGRPIIPRGGALSSRLTGMGQNGRKTDTVAALVESLKRHGIREEVINAALDEVAHR